MKLALALVSMFLVTTGAFAEETVVSANFDDLVSISNPVVEVKPAPQFAAVQPAAFLSFSYASCAKQPLKLEKVSEGNILFVKVILTADSIDCMGLPVARDYRMQISSDFWAQRVVVLNPLVPKMPTPAIDPNIGGGVMQPRPCTQNAGILVNNKTGKCVGFSNGCEENDMMKNGFRRPVGLECMNY